MLCTLLRKHGMKAELVSFRCLTIIHHLYVSTIKVEKHVLVRVNFYTVISPNTTIPFYETPEKSQHFAAHVAVYLHSFGTNARLDL